ncbi:Ribosomal RNA small subunit methyltransferase D [Anaerohalosphaera lusitana]|uniref:Ribosomal RNA small subunit methyltransferase D n=1 Tax=Anaerohalosphaera lusitana TaxID=1936003 RepID=A0A1U9NMS8_9BACT|nr:16S rRNA (guanine(966)-N(2))-methyltransferase RsmD [Anaerohalosphaera lusitana]AQT69044.1 Ribosomal RNA small subunit methyltransferase D [Anaerohalosphaera lusitana]
MRIIAGSKRGMKLLPPKNMETRPITDRAKEALFSVIFKYDMPADCVVGDLFCGTGSMGLECLSRGAKHATFIDQSAQVIDLLEKNISKAHFEAESKVIRGNVFKIGAPVGFEEPKYDLVFVDPPYVMARDTVQKSRLGRLLHLLCEQVRPGAIVIVRTHKRTQLEDQYGELKVIDERSWGSTSVTILRYEPGEQDDDE